jgi:HEAT repeat protein
LDIKTPDDHLKELRALAKSGPKQSPEEQDRIARELATEIRQETDPRMRRQLLRSIAGLQSPLAMAVLVAGTNDTDLEVRRVACQCLGARGGADAVQELTRVANSDTDKDVQIAAIRALGETREQTAMPALAEALVDADPAKQFHAKQGLKSVSGRDYGDNVDAWREYANTGKTDASEVGIAERLRRSFF